MKGKNQYAAVGTQPMGGQPLWLRYALTPGAAHWRMQASPATASRHNSATAVLFMSHGLLAGESSKVGAKNTQHRS
jgi:hypothetical protein